MLRHAARDADPDVRPGRLVAANSVIQLGTLGTQVLGMLILAPILLSTTNGDPLLVLRIALGDRLPVEVRGPRERIDLELELEPRMPGRHHAVGHQLVARPDMARGAQFGHRDGLIRRIQAVGDILWMRAQLSIVGPDPALASPVTGLTAHTHLDLEPAAAALGGHVVRVTVEAQRGFLGRSESELPCDLLGEALL